MNPQRPNQKIIIKALRDPEFKKRLIQSPKATLEKELKLQLPKDLEIQVLEEKENTVYLIIPFLDSDNVTEDELSSLSAGGPGRTVGGCPTKVACPTRIVNEIKECR